GLTGKQYPTPLWLWAGNWAVPTALAAAAIWRSRKSAPYWQILAIAALVLLVAAELVFVKDIYHLMNPPLFRTNTAFKLGYHAWILLIVTVMASAWRKTIVLPLLINAAVFPAVAVYQFYGILPNDSMTLDGAAFLEPRAPDTLAAIQWIKQNVRERQM